MGDDEPREEGKKRGDDKMTPGKIRGIVDKFVNSEEGKAIRRDFEEKHPDWSEKSSDKDNGSGKK